MGDLTLASGVSTRSRKQVFQKQAHDRESNPYLNDRSCVAPQLTENIEAPR